MAHVHTLPRAVAKHEFAPFEELVNHVRHDRIERWIDVEDEFIRVVGLSDTEFVLGSRDIDWDQSKTQCFNDLIVGLLANISGKPISMRQKKRSQIFDLVDIDICFPREGDPIVAAAVNMLGAPPLSGDTSIASGTSNDFCNRVREVAFSSMDLKAAYARPQPIRSFQNWADSTSPGYFSFWAIRAEDREDSEEVRSTLASSRTYCNGVGAVIYVPTKTSNPTEYGVDRVTALSIDRVIKEMAQRIA